MAATNQTTNYGLPQWESTDKPERADFNQAMSDIDTNLNLVELNLWKTIYPVGCLFETTDSAFNPQTHFGGTWSQYGAGRVTVGYSSGETEFNAGGKTGGAKTHSLTAAENGSHDHGVSITGTGSGALNHNGGYIAACETTSIGWNRRTGGNGSGSPHNNLQPYITVFRWRRTA